MQRAAGGPDDQPTGQLSRSQQMITPANCAAPLLAECCTVPVREPPHARTVIHTAGTWHTVMCNTPH